MDINEIRKLLSEATPGKWSIEGTEDDRYQRGFTLYADRIHSAASLGGFPVLDRHGLNLCHLDDFDANGIANRALIAAAPEAIAFLLGELEKVREAWANVEEDLERGDVWDDYSSVILMRAALASAYESPSAHPRSQPPSDPTRDAQKAQGAKGND